MRFQSRWRNGFVLWTTLAATSMPSVCASVFNVSELYPTTNLAYAFIAVPAGTDQIYNVLSNIGSRYNIYLYVLQEDSEVTIEVKADDESEIDPALVLIESETLVVVDADDDDKYSCDNISTLGPLDSCMTNDLAAGKYFIVVTGVAGSFGKYVINLSVESGPFPAKPFNITQPKLDYTHIPPTPSPASPPQHVFVDNVERGAGLYNFVVLPSGTDQVISQLETGDDDDVYYYILEEPATITVEAKAYQSSVDMFMIVLDATSYGLIDTDDDNEGDCTAMTTLGKLDSCLTLDLDAGVYAIYVESADSDKTGGYVINLSRPSGSIGFALPSPVPKTSNPTLRPTSRPATPQPTFKPNLVPTTNKPTSKPTSSIVVVKVPPGLCFSGRNQVEVETKGLISMDSVRIGDKVRDAKGEFTSVYSFGHYNPTIRAEYLQLHILGHKQPLEISKDHLLFVSGRAVPASLVVVGDVVSFAASSTDEAKVQNIKRVVRSGAYAPFTTSGTILVSGVAASCYVTLQVHSPVLVFGRFQSSLSMHGLSHVFQAPHRLVCSLLGIEFCRKTETYNEYGISSWVKGPYDVARRCLEFPGVILAAVFVPAFIVGLLICMLEFGWIYFAALFGALYIWKSTQGKHT